MPFKTLQVCWQVVKIIICENKIYKKKSTNYAINKGPAQNLIFKMPKKGKVKNVSFKKDSHAPYKTFTYLEGYNDMMQSFQSRYKIIMITTPFLGLTQEDK